jgi:ABC-2 type transport system ATP-binding protein
VELAAANGARPDWVAAVPGATVVASEEHAVVVELGPGADEQQLLDAARRAGRVRRFAPDEPTLAQLFRQAVA